MTWEYSHIRVSRRQTNQIYWGIFRRQRRAYWTNIASEVNLTCNTNYTGTQCKRKFHSLVNQYFNFELYTANDQRGSRSRAARLFYDDFRSRFWEEPMDEYDIRRDAVLTAQRRRNNNGVQRGNGGRRGSGRDDRGNDSNEGGSDNISSHSSSINIITIDDNDDII
ncbi:hypothetical protein RhiirA4_512196 [Rhizophagus irregularis]|uniref:Uncharacterized protein n=1 Tax=Rhizophagus irregularis TaxID=588596 RepID=A0A2I1GBV2_9GLOM|nr:hypothetical protein RhiirA4_512196 [Rhizophagus irregularis]